LRARPLGVVGRACLNDDHAQRVRNDIVQLAGDARLLLRGCAPRFALSLPLEPVSLLFDLADVGATRADAVPQQRGRDQKDDPGGAGTEVDPTNGEDGNGDRDDRGNPHRSLDTPFAKRCERVEGNAKLER